MHKKSLPATVSVQIFCTRRVLFSGTSVIPRKVVNKFAGRWLGNNIVLKWLVNLTARRGVYIVSQKGNVLYTRI